MSRLFSNFMLLIRCDLFYVPYKRLEGVDFHGWFQNFRFLDLKPQCQLRYFHLVLPEQQRLPSCSDKLIISLAISFSWGCV